jgi:hypothetical protein
MAIDKGSYVRAEAHPEYGVGRVLAVDAFSTRVLFSTGGVRVYKNSDMGRIKASQASEDDKAALDAREAKIAGGIVDAVPGAKPAKAAAKPRASRAKKRTADADGDAESA